MNGVLVSGLTLRFADGHIVEVSADQRRRGAGQHRRRPGARRLGEVALVDASSRVGELDTVFFETLLDENAACHIAWGAAIHDSFSDDLPQDEAP